MRDIIRDDKITPDAWITIPKQAIHDLAHLPQGDVLLHIETVSALAGSLANRANIGIWFDSDDDVTQIGIDIHRFPIIGVNFPGFMDGRGFSIGRLLRERYQYRGELRAMGHFVRDQLFYLQRCGFNAFDFADEENLSAAIQSLHDLSETYQAAADQPLPLFQR